MHTEDSKQQIVMVIIALILIAGVYYNWKSKQTWTAFYYPNGCLVCDNDYIIESPFSSKEYCLDWVESMYDRSNNPKDKYECGRNCKQKDTGLYLCDETVDA